MKEHHFVIGHGNAQEQGHSRVDLPLMETWADFVKVVRHLNCYGNLRSEAMMIRYAQIKKLIASCGQTPAGVIAWQVERSILDRNVAILPNAIPYDRLLTPINQVVAGSGQRVGHYCVWNQAGPLTDQEVIAAVSDYFRDALDWCGFENEEADKSMPSLWHLHIFVLEPST